MINLDTHIVVNALKGELSVQEERLLAGDSWGISDIVLWEMAMLSDRGRIEMKLDDPRVARQLAALHIWPIDIAVSLQSVRLDFRADPADHIIAATSIVYDVPLLTRDAAIRGSKIVPLA